MATMYGTYSCGHEGKIYLPGSSKSNDWRARRTFEGLCPECETEQNAKNVAQLRAQCSAPDAEFQMLEGSDKQILWAQRIRERFFHEAAVFLQADRKPENEEERLNVDLCITAMDAMRNIRSASWWIDHGDFADRMLREFVRKHRKELLEEICGKQEKEKKKNETIEEIEAAPEHLSTPLVAQIICAENRVSLKSGKDDVIIGVAKSMGMRWDGVYWVLTVNETNGPVRDRASELGNRLLTEGVAIRMPDNALLQNAVDGTFSPAHQHWVCSLRDDHVCISFPRDNEIYATARRLPGAKWDSGRGMAVPAQSVDEIRDFENMFGFKETAKAKEVLDKAYAKKHSRSVVEPTRVDVPQKRDMEKELKEILNSSRDIIDDLRED